MSDQHQAPREPMALGGARSPGHVPLEERQRRQQALHQWQDHQARHLKRETRKARAKAIAATTAGSLLILGLLWLQRAEPFALLIPAVLAVVLIASSAILSPWPDVAKALRQHRRARRAERNREG